MNTRWGMGALVGLGCAMLLGGARGPEEDAPRDAGLECKTLRPEARRGKAIYHQGRARDGGAIVGLLGEGGAALSGESAACARCHGVSGEGTEEGGVAAPALLAERLFVPDIRRGRPGHDDTTLAAAIREGRVGPRRLGPAMPRFTLDTRDIEDLKAYLHCLGHEREPGVTEGAIRVGAAWPLSGPGAAQGATLAAAVADVFAEVEAQGGLFRRRIEVVVEDSSGPGGAIAATERLARRDVFVVLASAPTTEPLRDDDGEEIPHIGPLGPSPRNAERVFQVRPGFDVLAQIAIGHAATAGRTSAFHVIAHDDALGRALRDGAAREASRRGLPTPSERLFASDHFDATAAAAEVRTRALGGIVFGGTTAELGAFVRALSADVDATIYAPSAILGDDPAALDRRAAERTMFLHAGLVDDRVPAFVRDLHARLRRRGVEAGPIGLAASTEVAARILIEGLRRAGSRPTRRGFVAALETLRDFEAGFSAPVSFGRGLRTGVMGAYLVRVDPVAREIVRVSDWLVASPLP